VIGQKELKKIYKICLNLYNIYAKIMSKEKLSALLIELIK